MKTIKEIIAHTEKFEKKYIDGKWVDVPKKKKVYVAPQPFFSTGVNWASSTPTHEQNKINRGMTEKKVAILNKRMDKAVEDARAGRISWARCLGITSIAVRDIQILVGCEKAYLQG